MRKVYCLAAIVLIGAYLVVGRTFWFAELERQARIGSDPVFSPRLHLARPGQITWKVPRETWGYEQGDAKLSLVLDRVAGLPHSLADRSNLQLRLRVEAYAIPEGGARADRLTRNWYYTTDEPFSEEARLWSSFGGDEIEYGLAGLRVYPLETVFTVVTVTTADPILDKGNPRLKLVGEHDYAVFEHVPMLRALRDGGMVVSLLLLIGLVLLAWRGRTSEGRET